MKTVKSTHSSGSPQCSPGVIVSDLIVFVPETQTAIQQLNRRVATIQKNTEEDKGRRTPGLSI